MALIFPISPLTSSAYLGKAFVVCVLGGLGSVSGALAGGLLLALVEGIGSTLIGQSFSDPKYFWVTSFFETCLLRAVDHLPGRTPAGPAWPKGF